MEPTGNYKETLDYLYSRLPMFSRLGKDAIKKDLTNIRILCEALGNPQDSFRSVHIAGTNGKGSTSHMLSAVLQKAGYKTGLYTSPHLVNFRERIRIDGAMIDEETVTDFVQQHRQLIEEVEPSFFEITVVLAFKAFAAANVDIAVIETGLGGRLDSTNIIQPLLSLITNVSYDHTDILGKTLQEIAGEKAGIIKLNTPVIIGERQAEIEDIFKEKAAFSQSDLHYADELWQIEYLDSSTEFASFLCTELATGLEYNIATDLTGHYQLQNIRSVLAAISVLQGAGHLQIPLHTVIHAFKAVKELSGLRGRWEVLQTDPLIIADVAHNPAGLKLVMEQWKSVATANKWIITGFVKDKDVSEALSYFPKDANYIFTQAQIPRALPVAELMAIAQQNGLMGQACDTMAEAVGTAIAEMEKEDALLICGSFFIVGEAMKELEKG